MTLGGILFRFKYLAWTVAVVLAVASCSADKAASGADQASADGADVGSATGQDAEVTDDFPEATTPACPGQLGCPVQAGDPCQDDSQCDDGDPCTLGETCGEDFTCLAGTVTDCDDGNVCTTDSCNKSKGCLHVAAQRSCDDGNECTYPDLCVAGACQTGPVRTCDDGNGCSDDLCDPAYGCYFAANTAECDKENACVEASFCADLSCVTGKAKPCDDGIICTYDVCDPKIGCVSLPKPGPVVCNDTTFDDRCWKVLKFPTPLTWDDARTQCQGWGGELASLHWRTDNDQARSLADQLCGKDAAVWIGLSDRAVEGKYVWSDGEPGDFSYFNSGEPNNSGNEDYIQMVPGGRWNDIGQGATMGCAVCNRRLANSCDDDKSCKIGALCSAGACLPATATRSCDDDDPCSLDSCVETKGCLVVLQSEGAPCSDGGICQSGQCYVNLPAAASDCASILQANPSAGSGIYWIDVDGAGPEAKFQTYCEMQAGVGAWTTVLQVDGNDPQAGYDGTVWTAKEATATTALGPTGAKNSGFWLLPVQQLRVGLRSADGSLHWLILDAKGASLQAIFQDGKAIVSKLGVKKWESLLVGASLQPACLLEGVNMVPAGGGKVRIGILGNNEDDCNSIDSWLGLGGSPVCGAKDTPSVGNLACWGPDHGNASNAALGYVQVR